MFKDPNKHIPWVVHEAKNWLDHYLNNNMKIFEYGSGGSTFYFSSKAKKVVSIEHNQEWYEEVKSGLDYWQIVNCDYNLIKPKKNPLLRYLPYKAGLYNSKTFLYYSHHSFKNYVRSIENYPDYYFDLIFIDGRARISCLKHAIKKITNCGCIVLDNSERPAYYEMMGKIDRKHKRIDFFGRGPYIEEEWQTSVWLFC